ncbi:hypothetical protein BAE44_0012629 [Dichanthelium oligosanthes]|uniref:RWP-RK domain-containing protein n=1 Tax=Dichanthelium oligosanthes TaxID=888268 RepID=A0A1E5VMS1_9POAL|nr:hypothetical protein BAE44_0012629 [Dichanthelium oligosanthes]
MQDDFDDVMYLLDIPDVVLDPPPLAAQAQNVTAGSSGNNNLVEWPARLDASVDDSAPAHNAAVAADPPSTAQDVDASTSAAASTSSSSAAHQNALDCTRCHVLRDVLHSNGFEATKLSIHGVAAVFYHATLEVYRVNSEGLATDLTHQSYIDFRGRDYVWVKHYLTGYAQQRAGGGYTLIHDSISAFHDALCTSMNYGGNADDDRGEGMEIVAAVVENGGGDQQKEFAAAADDAAQAQSPLIEQGDVPAAGPSEPSASNEQEQQEVHRPVGRSALAIQRERARDLQLSDIARYFHLRMTEAAVQLGVCPTVLKTTSRKFRVSRWPHRKIKSIDNNIAKLRRKGNGGTAVMREMQKLTEARRKIYADLLRHQ